MSWLRTLRQFLILIFMVVTVMTILYGALNLLGKAQVFHRLDHPVLKKVNNSIYLDHSKAPNSFNLVTNIELPDEIKSMTYLMIKSPDQDILPPLSECIFLDFLVTFEDQSWAERNLKNLSKMDCVFINSPDLRLRTYISREKPRWFFNQSEVDLQKSHFLTSLGLESLSPLKGDFIVFKEPRYKISDRLFAEIERRQMIIFLPQE